MREFYETLPQISSDLELAKISLGGGFGVAYQEKETPLDPAECRRLLEVFADLPIDLVLEPGRSLVAGGRRATDESGIPEREPEQELCHCGCGHE